MELLAPVVIVLSLILYAPLYGAKFIEPSLMKQRLGLSVHINLVADLYTLIITVLLSGFCVAIGGSIGFVGLISPHICTPLSRCRSCLFLCH